MDESNKQENPKEKDPKTPGRLDNQKKDKEIGKKISSMFDSLSEEQNLNVSSPLFRKTSINPPKDKMFKMLKEEKQEKEDKGKETGPAQQPPPSALKKSPEAILEDIPEVISSPKYTTATSRAPRKEPASRSRASGTTAASPSTAAD